jgi:hypothetical protein
VFIMSENGRKRSIPAGCAAAQTVTTVHVTPATQVGIETPAAVDRIVLHLGGIESTTDLVLHMSAADLLRLYLTLGHAAVDVIPAEQLWPMVRQAGIDAHLWGVDYVTRDGIADGAA